jgi:molybdenum cofactor synthesis domain-containing protein
MSEFLRVATVEEARAVLEKHWSVKPRKVEVPLGEAAGHVLAEDVVSEIDVPPFDRAALDGYAVRAVDTFGAGEESPVELSCVGSVRAGEWPDIKVGRKQCAEIATGAPIPRGANAVIMVEHSAELEKTVQIFRAVSPGENITRRGSEIKRGMKVLKEGRVITPQVLGTIAAVGKKIVKIYSPPKVAVISSGDELISAGSNLGPGKIYDVNGPAISRAVELCGGRAIYLGIARDEPGDLRSLLRKGLSTCDLVLVSGGSSAGTEDVVPKIVDGLGHPGVLVHGLALRPGKPTFVAAVRGKPVFGLPGYPVSALMVFDQLVAPYLRRLSGLPQAGRVRVRARLASKILSAKGRRELVPVRLVQRDGEVYAEPLFKGSGAITALSLADGYIDVPLEREIVWEGEAVDVILFGGAGSG